MRRKTTGESEAMILAKIHVVNTRKLVAVCDAELIGKKFEENNLQLDLTGEFYKGEEVNEEELQDMIKDAYVVNFVGKESVGYAIKNGLVKKENVIVIKDVQNAQVLVTTES